MYYINDFEVGYKVTYSEVATEEMHLQFSKLSGDNSPIHMDEEFCKNTPFKKRIGYAFLITTILSKIYGTIFPGGSELCLKQKCEFKKPYFVGDTLFFELEVTQKNIDLDLVTIKILTKNQEDIMIFKGEVVMQLVLGKV
ncbi:MaoC/PaaZ C-terminal domain-containing protein [Bacteriovoracaceae bacterium]|nr:MaoC/PaaZ C-terminal domain-containing protein [Bacteriovoracaceae bacterium]